MPGPFVRNCVIVRRHPHAAHTEVEGEVFVVTEDNRLHNLRGSSAVAIWAALERAPATIDELVHMVTERFEVEEERARKDVTDFVRISAERGVLLLSAPPE